MNARTTAFALAALACMLMWGAPARADSSIPANYWANHSGMTLNVGQGTYVAPAIAQPAPQEQPEGPAIEAAYREGPAIGSIQEAPAQPVFQNGYYYSFGNSTILLPK